MIQVFEDMFCPLCGRRMQKNDWAYGCSGWHESEGRCRFLIWKNFRGHTFTDDEVMRLLCGETIGPLKFKRKGTAAYSAAVCMDWEQLEPVVTGPIRLVKKGRPADCGDSGAVERTDARTVPNTGRTETRTVSNVGMPDQTENDAAYRTIGIKAPQKAEKGVEIEWLDE